CVRDCSFTSAEAASLSTTAMVLSIALWPRARRRGRFFLISMLGAVAAGGSFLRVMMGRHFLSDLVFSILLCALVVLGLRSLIGRVPDGPTRVSGAAGRDRDAPP
ncbi:phosphatase PAP2 family protein, partial [Amaricoccus solimangrovi]|uniref:phosphatase PAP2 family protein n=1 Tax=Amaricoccus solimangrovi TaxID=2589815 RepID=UPI0015E3479C